MQKNSQRPYIGHDMATLRCEAGHLYIEVPETIPIPFEEPRCLLYPFMVVFLRPSGESLLVVKGEAGRLPAIPFGLSTIAVYYGDKRFIVPIEHSFPPRL